MGPPSRPAPAKPQSPRPRRAPLPPCPQPPRGVAAAPAPRGAGRWQVPGPSRRRWHMALLPQLWPRARLAASAGRRRLPRGGSRRRHRPHAAPDTCAATENAAPPRCPCPAAPAPCSSAAARFRKLPSLTIHQTLCQHAPTAAIRSHCWRPRPFTAAAPVTHAGPAGSPDTHSHTSLPHRFHPSFPVAQAQMSPSINPLPAAAQTQKHRNSPSWCLQRGSLRFDPHPFQARQSPH